MRLVASKARQPFNYCWSEYSWVGKPGKGQCDSPALCLYKTKFLGGTIQGLWGNAPISRSSPTAGPFTPPPRAAIARSITSPRGSGEREPETSYRKRLDAARSSGFFCDPMCTSGGTLSRRKLDQPPPGQLELGAHRFGWPEHGSGRLPCHS